MLTIQASRVLQAVTFLRCIRTSTRWESLTHFSSSSVSCSKERIGPNGIQMLSKFLHEQIFGGTDNVQWNPASVEKSQQELTRHGLSDKKVPPLEDVQLQLPSLHGKNINDHFYQIASKQLEPYMKLVNKMLGAKLPPSPAKWSMAEGWTRYEHDGRQTRVSSPEEDCLVLDVEVCVQEGCAPTLAVATSPTHWYSWVSKRLASGEDDYLHKSGGVSDELISLGGFPEEAGLIIGHNVCYDRARVKEQYNIKNSNVRFLDTLSLHTCVAGQTADQKLLWKRRFGKEPWGQEGDNAWKQNWYYVSSPGDLLSTYWLHCGGKMDKSTRDMFVTESMSVIRDHFQELMQYCCDDVWCTQKLFCAVFPQFQDHCSHPVTLAGMLEMGTAYLPVNEQWTRYVHNCEWVYEDVMEEMKKKLVTLANNAITYQHDDRYKKDIWLTNLDWSVKNFRGKQTKKQMKEVMEKITSQSESDCNEEECEFIISSSAPLARRAVHMPGYPNWYRKLCLKPHDEGHEPGPVLLTAQTRMSPYLLKMTWNGYPLYHHSTKGWGYLVVKGIRSKSITNKANKEVDSDFYFDHLFDYVNESRDNYDEQISSGPSHPPDDEIVLEPMGQKALFYRLPHKDGPLNNVGNPLSHNFLNKMDDGTLYSQAGEEGRRILMLNSMISFWRSSRDRIRGQYVVWTDNDQPLHRVGCILPQLITAGTVTRRGVESTWLTASNPKENRVGSELKSLVQAPDGYHLVGADVDSQELWIASVIGDAHFAGLHGSTAVGWMTLQGKKSEGTDLHSKTASTIGITRDQAKVFNYGRIYGAGNKFAIQLLRQFNSNLSKEEAEEKASVLYAATKGTRRYVLSKRGIQLAKDYDIKVTEDFSIDWKQYRKLRDLFLRDSSNSRYKYMPRIIKQSYWSNGSESHMFNKLEEIATSSDPSTPVLGCKISRALKPQYVGTQYMTSRVNWVVQSSAVDYLHMMLVCMRWLIECYQIDARFCISIHDEVRYLVRSEDCYRAALALQITNLLTRSMFAYKLGMNDLPQSVAFFSAVDIDKVLRKEVMMDCCTPSNPLGLAKSQGISQGETVDIYQVMEITKGSLEKN